MKYALQHIDDLVQDCSNSIANALELLQSCTKPSMCQLGMYLIRLTLRKAGYMHISYCWIQILHYVERKSINNQFNPMKANLKT